CTHLEERNGHGSLTVDTVAEEFVHFFHLSPGPKLEDLKGLLESNGVATVRPDRLSGLRGVHYAQKGSAPTILYEEAQWEGGKEHTVLHETFELVYAEWWRRKHQFRRPSQQALCRAADRFAASVLMQPDIFRPFLYASGLDLIAMRQHFQRSYASVMYRAKEVLASEIDFIAALYERTTAGTPESWPWSVSPREFEVVHVARTARFPLVRAGSSFRAFEYPRHVMPRMGGTVLPGSAAQYVIETGRPLLVERVSGFDFWGYNDLIVLVRPVHWAGRLAKVMLLALHHRDRGLLETQVGAVQPERRPRAYQII
ncbi:MAG: ImmA/IrrE family metallo-endopeptidase, partial [Chloroflexi bacterium]|nr:ImmA/IrrE family metallo-endopeptidase [Chloroflexota bacterium]